MFQPVDFGHVLVAQLDRALVSGAKGQRFESSRGHYFSPENASSLRQRAFRAFSF